MSGEMEVSNLNFESFLGVEIQESTCFFKINNEEIKKLKVNEPKKKLKKKARVY